MPNNPFESNLMEVCLRKILFAAKTSIFRALGHNLKLAARCSTLLFQDSCTKTSKYLPIDRLKTRIICSVLFVDIQNCLKTTYLLKASSRLIAKNAHEQKSKLSKFIFIRNATNFLDRHDERILLKTHVFATTPGRMRVIGKNEKKKLKKIHNIDKNLKLFIYFKNYVRFGDILLLQKKINKKKLVKKFQNWTCQSNQN
ncbi:hypothetical protein BpHYR1_039477 [Brachionus plicatilis]|uniref:Uncharacterized protein n=1 Tax=Brachionus plicatilis TaxID=10195 RepID=A0A3M7QTU6_BRAPC|nr:hypothetical protein BpHYR1_039477 [Brachionus plicatilis]